LITETDIPSIAHHPIANFAYVDNYVGNSVSIYAISATTRILTALTTPTVAYGTYSVAITFKKWISW
jgi:hypothetical protein